VRSAGGRKPDCWSDSFWKSIIWPCNKKAISAEEVLDVFVKNNVEMILIGGYAGAYHNKSFNQDRKDYDFIINNNEKNLNLIFNLLSENYEINKKIFLSNIQNYLKLRTTSKNIDFIKKLLGTPSLKQTNECKILGRSPMKFYYSSKKFNYSILKKNSEKIKLNGIMLDVMGLQDYRDSQYLKPTQD
jgi:hypothetical protein